MPSDRHYISYTPSLLLFGKTDFPSKHVPKPIKMSLTRQSLSTIPLSYASCSIGCPPSHKQNLPLPFRLAALSKAGFTGIELSMPDLVTFANEHFKRNDIDNHSFDSLCSAAAVVKTLCDEHGLTIMLLQPFANFEGWPADSPERRDAFSRAEGWLNIMEACGCEMLQIGSTDTPAEKIGTDRARFVSDLREIADMAGERGKKIAYENWCWSTHAPGWEDVWDICEKVGRGNFGLCLDTFQSAGGEWGDPSTGSGVVEGGEGREEVAKRWQQSCQRLSETIPPEKIFLLQISDAYKPEQPFANEADENGMRPRARWSSAWRPLPFEGYLPVVDFAKAVLRTGFRGWFSYEIFDGGIDGQGKEYQLEDWAKAARECQRKLVDACVEG
ncbi:hypothetical protein LTR09_005690 [Extremus antarcticus]|uniref:Xylose isomerase-like TIM barrel domain-containing protein n=1 Tax=Extremus antarcticus TaxID=702011 RepID=A0AAJ0DMK0_9PEZI|nr:hypothetical protein LTR09_005690 [Extremus antarcticus]